jgi:ferredoxin
MRIQKALPKPAINWSHNFFAAIDTDICSGCGVCVERCQMNAIKLDEQSGLSTVNLDRCIGCGNCVASCPSEALKLVKKEKEIAPPEDRTGLYKLLAERK